MWYLTHARIRSRHHAATSASAITVHAPASTHHGRRGPRGTLSHHTRVHDEYEYACSRDSVGKTRRLEANAIGWIVARSIRSQRRAPSEDPRFQPLSVAGPTRGRKCSKAWAAVDPIAQRACIVIDPHFDCSAGGPTAQVCWSAGRILHDLLVVAIGKIVGRRRTQIDLAVGIAGYAT